MTTQKRRPSRAKTRPRQPKAVAPARSQHDIFCRGVEALVPRNGTEFVNWRMRHQLNTDSAADCLGFSRRNLFDVERQGAKPLAKKLRLACASVELGVIIDD